MATEQLSAVVKNTTDALAVGVSAASAAQIIPWVLALPAFIWAVVRLYEWWRWVRNGRKGRLFGGE